MTIDWWTLGLQTVNVVILVWLLRRFFWRPVAAMIEQRRVSAQQMLSAAVAKQHEADGVLAENQQARAGFSQEREAILTAAHADAERMRNTSLDETAKVTAAMQAAARSAIEKEQQAADHAWAERASHLAIDIAARLAARLDGAVVREAFLRWLLEAVRALPEPTRQGVASGAITIEAISATPLDPGEQERVRKQISDAFGADLAIDFKVEAALIVGLELHGPHLVMLNSWRADLAQILADLQHDNRS